MDINKWMPVHSTSRKMLGMDAVPMSLFNEEWASANHGQTLHRLAERGGLGLLEMLDNIYKRRLSYRTETSEDAALLIKIIQDKTQPSTLPLIETEDLQDQVREHINSYDLFDWHEALTENEMTYLENLLLTFNPLCPPGSIGFEEQKRHIQKSVPLIDKGEQSDAVEFKDWCDSGKAWFFDNNEEHTHTTKELYKLFKNSKQ